MLGSKKILILGLLSAGLFGCGGGGDTSTPAAPVSTTPTSQASSNTTNTNTSSNTTNSNNNTSNTNTVTTTPSAPVDLRTQEIYAARFLNQATFGATRESIDEFITLGQEAWFERQISLPQTMHLTYLENTTPDNDAMEIWRNHRMDAWFNIAVRGNDQLRQKVAYALSQIFVISDKSTFDNDHMQIANYYDMLGTHAFGNYRDLLEDVTLSPLMGIYLSMRGNEKPDLERNIRPDENYAREVMQLFSIGLDELNIDGSYRLDNTGQRIQTYNQDIIKAYAHVFTGWNFAGTTEQTWYRFWRNYNTFQPMEAVQAYHDKGEKRLLNDVVIPAGQTAEEDLAMALDSLFEHPNVGPFMAKRLIQHLVTSNPSPAYIRRVAQTFNDNGQGVRGDLQATIKAILFDEEARADYDEQLAYFGKVKEPILKGIQLYRGLAAFTPSNVLEFGYPDWVFNQAPLSAPSVFNFYLSDHKPQGPLAEAGLSAPELSILTENYVVRNSNFAAWTALWGHYRDEAYNPTELVVDFAYEATLLDDTDALLDHLDLMLLAGAMPDAMRPILEEVLSHTQNWDVEPAQRIADVAFLIAASPQFAVQR